MAKRVTYRPVTQEYDYVDVRQDVLLDGEVIGQVTRDRRTTRHAYAGKRYGYDTTATAWQAEAPGFRAYRDHPTRMDAVIDLLTSRHGMGWDEAREAVGKRGLW